MKHLMKSISALALLSLSIGASAALHDRGGGMMYDDKLDITWLKDWNLPQSSGVSQTGHMTWNDAMAWADGLTFGGYTDWRLPRLTALGDPDCTLAPYVCNGSLPTNRDRLDYSELSNVWYLTLGAKPGASPLNSEGHQDWGIPAGQLVFENVPVGGTYWLADRFLGMNLWSYSFNLNGVDSYTANWDPIGFAVAVRQGDVLAAIPEPGTTLLWAVGLVGMALSRANGGLRNRR